MTNMTTSTVGGGRRTSRLSTMLFRLRGSKGHNRERCVLPDFRQLNDHTLKDVGLQRLQVDCVFGCGD